MPREINAVRDNDNINVELEWTTTGPEIKADDACKLSFKPTGKGVRLTGRVAKTGPHEVIITETRTATVTINVAERTSLGESTLWEAFTGNRRPADPES